MVQSVFFWIQTQKREIETKMEIERDGKMNGLDCCNHNNGITLYREVVEDTGLL